MAEKIPCQSNQCETKAHNYKFDEAKHMAKCHDCEYRQIEEECRNKTGLSYYEGSPDPKSNKNKEDDNLLYHYRDFDTFWKIVESNSFWATNVRFSNDNFEQTLGKDKFIKIIFHQQAENDHKELEETSAQLLGDCYFICFCQRGDILSQWRGYARDGGVAIGLDYANIQPFCLEIKPEDGKVAKFVSTLNACCQVIYLNQEDMLPKALRDGRQLNKGIDKDYLVTQAQKLVPFIKHKGFVEEDEYRLVFFNDNNRFTQAIRYQGPAIAKKPYVIVKPGMQESFQNEHCVVRFCCNDAEIPYDSLFTAIKGALDKLYLKAFLVNCHDGQPKPEEHCSSCTIRQRKTNTAEGYYAEADCRCWGDENLKRAPYAVRSDSLGIYITPGKSQQKIHEIVRKVVRAWSRENSKPRPPIWCDGYLPIRKIIVGPSKDHQAQLDSIKHYCKFNWWLNDVEVLSSEIPFRG